MSKPRIAIVISSTREGRFGDRVANWVNEIGQRRTDLDFEIVDLRGFPVPFFNAPVSPRFAPVTDPQAITWARKFAEFDGYVFVTAEYNHAIPAVLKNALDYLNDEGARKPATFVGYGVVGGARAVEQMRLITIELSMVALTSAVHVGMEPFLGLLQQGKDFADYPYLAPTVDRMLEELSWYAHTLRAGRQQSERAAA
jgi:NAD(P)H-dependent FMN reductase